MTRLQFAARIGGLAALAAAAQALPAVAAETAGATVTSAALPSPVTISQVNQRQFTITTTERGRGVYVTCDSGEIAAGGFCEEVMNKDRDAKGALVHNAMISAGVVSLRSVACKWTNPGVYKASATCLAVKPLAGDSAQGEYDSAKPGDVK